MWPSWVRGKVGVAIILLSAVVEVPEVQSGMAPFHILIPQLAVTITVVD